MQAPSPLLSLSPAQTFWGSFYTSTKNTSRRPNAKSGELGGQTLRQPEGLRVAESPQQKKHFVWAIIFCSLFVISVYPIFWYYGNCYLEVELLPKQEPKTQRLDKLVRQLVTKKQILKAEYWVTCLNFWENPSLWKLGRQTYGAISSRENGWEKP